MFGLSGKKSTSLTTRSNGGQKKSSKQKSTSTSKGGYSTPKFRYTNEPPEKKTKPFAQKEIAKEATRKAKLAKMRVKIEQQEEKRSLQLRKEESKTELARAKAERRAAEREATEERLKKARSYFPFQKAAPKKKSSHKPKRHINW